MSKQLILLHGLPDALIAQRQVKHTGAASGTHGVGYRGCTSGDGGFADTTGTEGAEGGFVVDHDHFDIGQGFAAGEAIVHEAGSQQLTVIVINHCFVQGPTEPLGHTAMDLTFDQQGVEGKTNVLDGEVLEGRDMAGVGIDMDFDEVGDEARSVF